MKLAAIFYYKDGGFLFKAKSALLKVEEYLGSKTVCWEYDL
jgi:hypothetical protein